MAKNFEQRFPNLENLKKFNGFSFDDEDAKDINNSTCSTNYTTSASNNTTV